MTFGFSKEMYATKQASGAYSSNRGECVEDKQQNPHCKSIFKDGASVSTSFNRLWAEVINQLERTKYVPGLEIADEIVHNSYVQSHSYQNKKIETLPKPHFVSFSRCNESQKPDVTAPQKTTQCGFRKRSCEVSGK